MNADFSLMVEMLRMMIKCHTMRKADSTYEWTLLVCLVSEMRYCLPYAEMAEEFVC